MIKKETERAALTERRHFRDPKTPRGKLPSPLLPGQKGDGRAGRSHCPRPARPSPPRSSPCRPHPLTVRGGAGRWPRPPPPATPVPAGRRVPPAPGEGSGTQPSPARPSRLPPCCGATLLEGGGKQTAPADDATVARPGLTDSSRHQSAAAARPWGSAGVTSRCARGRPPDSTRCRPQETAGLEAGAPQTLLLVADTPGERPPSHLQGATQAEIRPCHTLMGLTLRDRPPAGLPQLESDPRHTSTVTDSQTPAPSHLPCE